MGSSIATAWLIAGTIDILIAVTYYPLTTNATPIGILQGIASGLVGGGAFRGGLVTATLGLACHYTIALIWTLLFFILYPRLRFLSRSRLLTAALYGTFVSAAMNLVVLPLSRVAHRPFNLSFFIVATIILMVSIGLPLAIVGGRYYAKEGAR